MNKYKRFMISILMCVYSCIAYTQNQLHQEKAIGFRRSVIDPTLYEQYGQYSFMRFAAVIQYQDHNGYPVLTMKERDALYNLIKAKDKLGAIYSFDLPGDNPRSFYSGEFALYVGGIQERSHINLAPQFYDIFIKCVHSMPETSAFTLLDIFNGSRSVETINSITRSEVIKDFNAAIKSGCKDSLNNINTIYYKKEVTKTIESIIAGNFEHGMTSTLGWIFDNLNDALVGKPNAIFGIVAYDYLKTILTAAVADMGSEEGLTQLSRQNSFTTFVDFLRIAKTKTSMPGNVVNAITHKCFSNVSDIFKPFNLQRCGADTFSTRTFVIGDNKGKLVSLGGQ